MRRNGSHRRLREQKPGCRPPEVNEFLRKRLKVMRVGTHAVEPNHGAGNVAVRGRVFYKNFERLLRRALGALVKKRHAALHGAAGNGFRAHARPVIAPLVHRGFVRRILRALRRAGCLYRGR